MARLLLKSEPDVYAWSRLSIDGGTRWDGVRNHQAAANLRSSRVGERSFFYHSNTGREIVGVVETTREAYPDPTDAGGRFVAIDVRPVAALRRPVTLLAIKADPFLSAMALVRQSRLSVCPVTEAEWERILELAGGTV